jgi:hypothetical protein
MPLFRLSVGDGECATVTVPSRWTNEPSGRPFVGRIGDDLDVKMTATEVNITGGAVVD